MPLTGAGPAWVALGLLTVARLAVAAFTPLSPDEAYYWVWSRAPAFGYLDHPPMVAWFIAAGTAIAGDTPLGIRLLAPVATAIGSAALVLAGNRLFPVERPGLWAAVLFNATLVAGIGSVTMTPDTPLLLFWTLTLAALAGWVPTGSWGGGPRVGLGVVAGLALLSKYTAVLLAPSVVVWLLANRALRRWLADPRLWGAAALALVVFAPVLLWNAVHGWASFAKQGGRAGDWNPGRALQFLGELVGGQVGLATPLIAMLFAAGIWQAARRFREPGRGLLAALTIVPGAVFVEHALGDRVQANWPAIVFPAAAIAAALLGGRFARWRVPAAALGFAVTAIVWLQGLAAPFPLPRAADPTLMRLGGWTALASAVAASAEAEHAAFVVDDNYGHAAMLALLLPRTIPVLGAEPRWAMFNLDDGTATVAGRTGLLVRSERRADPPGQADWSAVEPAGELVRARGGVTAERYRLYRVTGRAGVTASASVPIAVMPRPR